MKFMLMRKADFRTEQGELPSQEILGAMADYNERMTKAGVFVSGNGLRPTSEGCRIQMRDGQVEVISGPFTSPGEQLAGYSILEVDSLEQAIDWARQWPVEDNDGNVTLELRRYFELSDFEPGPGLAKHQQQARLPTGLNVHLSFPGTCHEAMQFYAEVTGGELEALLSYAQTPAAEHVPASLHDKIIHASLNIRGRRLMGADMPADQYVAPLGVQVQLEYQDPVQAETAFTRLLEGGQVIMPFEQTFWAYRFGMLTDRFGVHWMINCEVGPCPQSREGEPT